MRPDGGTRAVLNRIPESWGWMAPDLLRRLLPFAAVVAVVEIVWRPSWLGFSAGPLGIQLVFAAVAAPVVFVAAAVLPPWPGPPPGGPERSPSRHPPPLPAHLYPPHPP